MTTLPADILALGLVDLEGQRAALLDRIAAFQRAIGAIRRNDCAIRLTDESFGRLSLLRSDRARLLNQLRRVHELIEAVSCEEPFESCSTPPST